MKAGPPSNYSSHTPPSNSQPRHRTLWGSIGIRQGPGNWPLLMIMSLNNERRTGGEGPGQLTLELCLQLRQRGTQTTMSCTPRDRQIRDSYLLFHVPLPFHRRGGRGWAVSEEFTQLLPPSAPPSRGLRCPHDRSLPLGGRAQRAWAQQGLTRGAASRQPEK